MHPNSLANLRPPFSRTNQPENKPIRKPSRLKKYIKDNNLSNEDISSAAKFILPKTQQEIQSILMDEKIPLIIRLFCKAVLDDLKKSRLTNISLIFDRAVGKPLERKEDIGPPINIIITDDDASLI